MRRYSEKIRDVMRFSNPTRPPPAAAPAVPKPAAVAPVPKKIIILRGVNFGFDSATLTPQSRALLDEHVAVLKKERSVNVEVAGHTDGTGPGNYNKGLSERRAKSVLEYLISKGIPSESLRAGGMENPIPLPLTSRGKAARQTAGLSSESLNRRRFHDRRHDRERPSKRAMSRREKSGSG
jgi:outer membrane protein OmpA-like peptidoglycan-associated protein